MRKFLATLMMMALMAVALPLAANAHTYGNRYTRNRTYTSRTYKRPNFYQRNRNLINIGIGAGAGALVGGLTKGKKGALVGSLIGAGGGALYTYVLNPKKKRYYRR